MYTNPYMRKHILDAWWKEAGESMAFANHELTKVDIVQSAYQDLNRSTDAYTRHCVCMLTAHTQRDNETKSSMLKDYARGSVCLLML